MGRLRFPSVLISARRLEVATPRVKISKTFPMPERLPGIAQTASIGDMNSGKAVWENGL
jgi:hypothetical protein